MRGAAGAAYRAYQPAVGREVAIKVIRPDLANDPAFIRRFQAEAQVVATLEHPHIVPLYDYWREPDAAYLVMRLMRGGNLASVLERGALTPAQTMTMVDQLGNALQTAHRSGVVHGDINSDNVLLDDDGNAYLSDFGIAVGAGEVAARSDISSLGVLVAQALTGRSGAVDELRDELPDPVARVIDRAIGVDAAGRYESVGDLVDDLHEALGGGYGTTGDDARAGDVGRQPVQGTASVRRRRCSRLLRSRTTRRTADRAPRSQRHPRAVHRRRRSEWQRQVERGEGRAASRDPAWGGPPVRFVVHDRDDPGKPSVRAARGRAPRRRRRSATLVARAARRRPGSAACGRPRVAP